MSRALRRCQGCDTLRPADGLHRTDSGLLCGRCRQTRTMLVGAWTPAPVKPVFVPAPGAMMLFEDEAEMREALR